MRFSIRHITSVIITVVSLSALAVDEPQNTACFYNSWQQVFELAPDTMIVDPMIDVFSPTEVYLKVNDKAVNKRIKNDYLAASLEDTTWLINSNYLRKCFSGDSNRLHGYVLLFFNEKVAYAVAEEYGYAELGDMGFNVISTYDYYIDFQHRRVVRIDSETLSALLSVYPELRMRYEGMADYKKMSIINEFFIQYVERAGNDPSLPDILDLVNEM